MATVLVFFGAHWALSVFFQTFFLHRYGAHRMFTMSRGWERFFYVCTWLAQGSSFLVPRAYAILHREHHAYSDTARDPHSPHHAKGPFDMMWKTKKRYHAFVERRIQPEPRFDGGYPEWPALDRFGDSFPVRFGFGVLYTLVYIAYAPHWAFYLLLPFHYLMGPVHGAIVNYCGHKYGYRNFATPDQSRNTLPFDVVTLGELFQNNHHRYGMAPNFAARRFEIDPTWFVIRALAAVGIVKLPPKVQRMRWKPQDRQAAPAPDLTNAD